MSEIPRFDVYGSADYHKNGSLVDYDDHKAIVAEKDKEIEEGNLLIAAYKHNQQWVEEHNKRRNVVKRLEEKDKEIERLKKHILELVEHHDEIAREYQYEDAYDLASQALDINDKFNYSELKLTEEAKP